MSWVFLHNPCSPPGLSPLLCRLERLYLESAVQSTTLGGLGQNVPGPRLHAENKMGEWALLLSLLKRILPLLGPYSLKSHSSCNEELSQELALPFLCKHCPCCEAAEAVWREIFTATGELLFFPFSSPWALLPLCYLLAISQWAETNSQSGTLLEGDVI